MLVLSRRAGESIRLNDDIQIKVFQVGTKRVMLGIAAPENVSIKREEIFEEIQADQKARDVEA